MNRGAGDWNKSMSELIQMYATSFPVLRLSDVTNICFPSAFFPWLAVLSKEYFTNFRYVMKLFKKAREKKQSNKTESRLHV